MASESRSWIKARNTDLPVMLPYRLRNHAGMTTTQWLASMPVWTGLMLALPLLLWPFYSHAAGNFTR